MIPTSDGLAIPSHLATARLAKFPPGKTNPLSDPSQQQKLMDALNKLKSEQMTPIEEQQQQQQQQQSSLSAKSGIFAAPANVLAPNQSLPQTAVAAVQPMPAAHLPYLINQQLLAQQAAAAADIIRLVQQQQQQRQQAIRLQQLQLMQQMTSVPRLPVPGKQLTQEEYQQMLALTLFQQQQQAAVQRAAAAAAAGNASAVDILRQRALLAAAALPNAAALQQAQLFNSFRQPNFSQPPPDAPNVRNLLNVGGLSGAVVPNAAATANLNAAAAKSLMEEIERLQKSQQQPPQ
uniref:Uncharacterized protein n=1 Tax=Romanomermis culicivorax TaxID=13658 RepID=A0A915KCV0_ROMCU